MKCKNCPAYIDSSNESNGSEHNCFYGEDYEDFNCYEHKDGNYGCRKQLKTIEKDLEYARKHIHF